MHGQETSLLVALIISCSIVFLIMGYFIIANVRHHRRNRQLYKEKLSIEISTLEKERKRVAADLHDELGPMLSAVRLQIQTVNSMDKEDEAMLAQSAKYIDRILLRVRGIANDLMPSVLVRKGLVQAVEEFTNGINDTEKKLHIEFSSTSPVKMETERAVHVYRIVQEIIHNCLRHADAGLLSISIVEMDHKLLVQAVDDGKGFDADRVIKYGTGHGLSNLLSRVDMLNGYIQIKSRTGSGASITIEIPQ